MITEKDFIDKMVEIAKDGYEYMDQLQCIFFGILSLTILSLN